MGRLIDEPRLQPLIMAVEAIVKADGIKEEFILSSENKDAVMEKAIREIVSNIAEFDDWYFADGADERKDRLAKDPADYNASSLFAIVQEVVEYNLESMRVVNELTVEPDSSVLINQLVEYIINWQNWFYDYKAQQDRLDWFERGFESNEIYTESDYGDPDKSQGYSNLYDTENAPYPGKEIAIV